MLVLFSAKRIRHGGGMYTPANFKVEDRAKIAAVMRAHSFATIVTTGARGLVATHLPFLFREEGGPHGTLFAHMARANPQWRDFASGGEVLVIFEGEHGYISPTWYASLAHASQVPTWNYEAVHAYGVPRLIDDSARALELLEETVRAYEQPGSAYSAKNQPSDYIGKLVGAIVAFEIPLTRVEAKFKLSQNREREDIVSAIAGLEATKEPSALKLAAAMRRENGV